MNLNGHTLTINGNLYQTSGDLKINGGELHVKGDYYIQKVSVADGDVKAIGAATGTLYMTEENDRITVDGDFVMGANVSSADKLTAGILTVKGNVTQITYANAANLAMTGAAKLVLAGNKAQKMTFANMSSSESRFCNLEITNTSEEGVDLGENGVYLTGVFDDNGNAFKGYVRPAATATFENNTVNGNVKQTENYAFAEAFVIKGDYYLTGGTGTIKGDSLTVEGKCTQNGGSINVNGKQLLVAGNMEITSGSLDLNNGTVRVAGNFNMPSTGLYNSACVLMNDADDYFYVDGNFYVAKSNYYGNIWTNGVLEIKGDFTQETNGYDGNFVANNNHKTILSGEKKQTVKFTSQVCTFNILELKNTSKDGVHFDSAILNARTLIKNGTKIHMNSIGIVGWTLDQDTVIEDDVYLVAGTLDLNGHSLKIAGNFYVGGGIVDVNGGSIEVARDMRIQAVKFGEEGQENIYSNSTAVLKMKNSSDQIIVGGDFIMQSQESMSDQMTAGTLEIKGDFYQNGANAYNFRATGSYKTVFSGTKQQIIQFANPSYVYSSFQNLVIRNTSTQGVLLKSNVYVAGALEDEGLKIKKAYTTYIKKISQLAGNRFGGNLYVTEASTMDKDITVDGAFTVDQKMDLNGFTLNTGNYTVASNVTIINGGNLSVAGTLTIERSGYLKMTNPEDYVCVSNGFVTNAYSSHKGYLTAGTLEIKGDFTQNYTSSKENFLATDEHVTVLSGKAGTANRNYVQVVKFATPESSKFNKVILNKASSLYQFSTPIEEISASYENISKDDEAPAKVTGLAVKNTTATKVMLTWNSTTDNEAVTGYELYRNGVKVGTTSKTDYTDGGLMPNITYTYKVAAFDAVRNVSEMSDQVSVITKPDTEAPSVPSGLKIKTKTGSAITITWNASTDDVGVKGYAIYRNGEEVEKVNGTTSYRDTDVNKDTLYSYQVKAFDAAGNESEACAAIKGSVQMPEIIDITPAHNSEIGGGKTVITVYYKNAGNALGNKVKYEYQTTNDAGDTIWEQIGGVMYGQKFYNTSTLKSECTWDYSDVANGTCKLRVTLYDADLNEDVEEVDYTIDTMGPEEPEWIKAKSENGVIELKWNESDSVDTAKYLIYRSGSKEGNYALVATTQKGTTTYNDVNVETGKTYYYKVSGVDKFGQEGKQSEIAWAEVTEDEDNPEVVSISVKDCRINGTKDVIVTATDNQKVASATLEYEDPESKEWVIIDKADKEADEKGCIIFAFDTTTVPDGVLKLRAVAKDAAGNASAGNFEFEGASFTIEPFYANVTIDNTGIGKIKINEATGYPTYVTLKWDNVTEDDFSYFAVEKWDGTQYKRVATSSTTLGAHIQNLIPDTTYKFRVVGYDDLGNRGIESDEVEVTTSLDDRAPIIKSFVPANKYFDSSIPLELEVTDNVGITSLKLTYSTDHENWNDLKEITLQEPKQAQIFRYDFDVAALPEGEVYIRAYAYDAAGNVSNCDGEPIENQFIVDRTAPSKVTNLLAEGMNGYIATSWDKAVDEDVAYFRIYRAQEEIGNYTVLADGLNTNVYYDTQVEYGKTYTYKVVAVDQAGNVSGYSEEAVAQSLKDDEAPVIAAVAPQTGSKITKKVEIKALVTDNVAVKEVTFEYKPQDSDEGIWSDLGTVAIDASTGYPSVTWDVSKFDNKAYDVRITASDVNDNICEPMTVSYVVDTAAPAKPVVTGTAIGFGAKLSWDKNTEEDFAYYEVYRKLGGEEDYTCLGDQLETTYEDTGLLSGRKYQYKVYAYDDAGNASVSDVCTVIPSNEDKENPVAITSEVMSVRAGSELMLDASASYDNVKIASYKWDMGNGDVIYGVRARYVYKEMGTYQAKLIVTDTSGNTDSVAITVRVRARISAQVNFKVFSQAKETNMVMSNAYIYIKSELGEEENYMADCYGELSVVLSAGNYEVSAYKEGFMPKHYDITVGEGDEIEQILYLEKGELVTGKLTATRLTLEQIRDLGVDLQDPNNWYTYTYTLTYTLPGTPVKRTTSVALTPGTVTRVYGSGGSGGSSGGSGGDYYVGLTEVEGKKVVTIYRSVSYLKKMYDIELQVTNNAEAGYGFDIVQSTATLNLPSGLSLLKISRPQYLTTEIGTDGVLKAQSTETTHWYIKADQPGDYELSATFNGTLLPFNAPVKAVIKADQPLNVSEKEDNTFTDDGFCNPATDYVIRAMNKQGGRVKGAIVTLEYGGKKSQTITNSRGTALLHVNPEDGRNFNLSVIDTTGEYEKYENSSYFVKLPSYTDKITLYRPGESHDEEEDEDETTNRRNPYLEGYDIGLVSACLNGQDVITKTRYINRAESKLQTLSFSFTEDISKYELKTSGETLMSGNASGSSLTVSINGNEIKNDGGLYLTVYGKEKQASYNLHVGVECRLYDTIGLKYTDSKGETDLIADILTESYTVFTSRNICKVHLTCNLLADVKETVNYFALVQGDEQIATSKDGKFDLMVFKFKPFETVYMEAYDANDELIKRDKLELGVQYVEPLPPDFKLSLTSEGLEFTIDDRVPLFGGQKIKIGEEDLDLDLPYDLEYTNEGCKITIGTDNDGCEKKIPIIGKKLNVKLNVSGSLFGSYDSQKWEGSITVTLSAEGELNHQLVAFGVPVVVDVTVSGSADATGKVTLDMSKKDSERLSGALESVLKAGVELYAGIGVQGVLSAGIYGAAELEMDLHLLPRNQKVLSGLSLSGEAGLKAKAFFYETSMAIIQGTWKIYPKSENIDAEGMSFDELEVALNNLENYTPMQRDDSIQKTEWYGEQITADENTIQKLQGNVYDGLQPNMQLSSNKVILLYNNDNTDKDVQNGSEILMSVYADGKFSQPVGLGDLVEYAQYGFDTYESDGTMYVIWQEAKKEMSEHSTLQEVSESIELKAAKYDAAIGRFTSLGTLTKNEKYEALPQICEKNGQVYAVWSVNTEGDIFGKKGTNEIYKSVLSADKWSKPEKIAEVKEISELEAGSLNDEIVATYVGVTAGVTDLTNGSSSTIDGSITNMEFGYFDQKQIISWYQDGKLFYKNSAVGEQKALFEDITIASKAYKYISDANHAAIVYTLSENGQAQAYVTVYDTELKKWGSPQSITTQDKYIENISGAYQNGDLILVFNQTTANIHETNGDMEIHTNKDLCYMKVGQKAKLTLQDISYNYDTAIPGGDVPLTIAVSNIGLKTAKADEITLTVQDESGKVVAQSKGTKDVRAGQSQAQELTVKLPYTLAAAMYKVMVEYNGETDEKEITIGYADLSVAATIYADHGWHEVEATVENIGVEAAGGKLIFINDADGTVLAERKIEELNYGKKAVETFVIGEELYDGSQPLRIRVKVTTQEEQVRTDNDEAVVYLAATENVTPYRVVFCYDNGNKVKKYVKSGNTVEFPADPIKVGYTFNGWYQGKEEFKKDQKVTKDITLYAQFEKLKEKPAEVKPSEDKPADVKPDDTKPNTNETKKVPAKNKKFVVGGLQYKVTKSAKKNGTVTVVKDTNKKKTSVKIPATVKINGYTFKVTAINANAFKNKTKLKKVVVGKNVTSIGKNAFNGCKNLKTVQIDSKKLKSVGKNAFRNINGKAKIKVAQTKLKKYLKLLKKKGQKSTVKIVKK